MSKIIEQTGPSNLDGVTNLEKENSEFKDLSIIMGKHGRVKLITSLELKGWVLLVNQEKNWNSCDKCVELQDAVVHIS